VLSVTAGPRVYGPHPLRDSDSIATMSRTFLNSSENVNREQTAKRWLIEATPALSRVTSAERRLSVSLAVNEVTMLAASDELAASTRDALAWLATNTCPVVELGSRVAQMLKICAEVALTAQRASSHPSGNMEAILDRLSNLLAIVEIHTYALDNW
jgi:hypothetical protein